MNTCPICKSAIISGDNKICGSCLRLYQRVYRKKKAIELPKEQWIVVPDTHEAIIDPDTFDRVQMLLSQNVGVYKRMKDGAVADDISGKNRGNDEIYNPWSVTQYVFERQSGRAAFPERTERKSAEEFSSEL